MKNAVIIKLAAKGFSLTEAKNKMVADNPEYAFRGIRPQPQDGAWIAYFEKQAAPFPAEEKMDTTATPEVYGDEEDLNLDPPTPSDDLDLDPDKDGDVDDTASLLKEIRDVVSELRDAVSALKSDVKDESDDLGDLPLGDDDLSEEIVDFEDPHHEEEGKFIAKAPVKLYRPKEANLTKEQAKSELIRAINVKSPNNELAQYRSYRIASFEDQGDSFVATLERKVSRKKSTPQQKSR